MNDWLKTVLGTFVGLLPIVNPFSAAVVFLVITRKFSHAKQQQQATMACLYSACVLTVFLVAGALIMSFFGISLPAVQIAGGLIVARIGFGMLQAEPTPNVSDAARDAALETSDVAFTPLAMPMMSGPGAIAVTIGMAANAGHWSQHVAIAAGILLVMFTTWLVLRAAERVVHFLGVGGVNALSRIMGFLLVCVGVQFIGVAVTTVVSGERFLRAMVEALRNAAQ